MLENILLMILGGGLTIGIYTSIQLFLKKGALKPEFRFLAFITILCCINFIHPHLSLIIGSTTHFNSVIFVEPGQFLLIPFIWLYIRNHLNALYKFSVKDLLHFIPSLIISIFLISPLSAKYETLFKLPVTTIFAGVLLFLQSLFYMWRSNRKIRIIKKKLSEELSSFKSLDLSWIQSIFIIFTSIYIINVFVISAILHNHNLLFIKTTISILFLIAILYIGHRSSKREEPLPIPSEKKPDPVTKTESNRIEANLSELMKIKKLYLNPELTLNELAENLNCTRNEISWVLNNIINKNFYNYINEYRVNEVISLMKSKDRDHQKILALAFDAGFNSKPAFNSIFRKITGSTPSEYRNKIK